jgi:predicted outer membrane repeat protein
VDIIGHSTIDGNGLDRVFHIINGPFFLNGATVRGGRAITADTATSIGGGMLIEPGTQVFLFDVTVTDNTAFQGGGIYSSGKTKLTASRLTNNQAIGRVRADGVILFARGGAVRTAAGSIDIEQSTVGNNGIVTAGDGAGISAQSAVLIRASTISGNLASLPGAFASAISVLPNADNVIVAESTISNNAGPAVVSTAGSGGTSHGIIIVTTTMADNSGPVIGSSSAVTLGGVAIQTSSTACQSIPVDTGYNVASDTSCSFTATGDVQGLSPLVGPVADNGGPTLTNLPFKNSPMLHKIPFGTSSLCDANQPTDQRGVARPTSGFCNIGSVEGNSPKNGITVS